MKSPRPPSISNFSEEYPEIVRLIGELSTEFNSLDIICGWFFGYILRIHFNVAHVIFHTPKAYYQRVETLENAILSAFELDSEPIKQCQSLVKRYRKIVDKRHRIIHDAWLPFEGEPSRRQLPFIFKNKRTPVNSVDLERLLDDVRTLAHDVYQLLPDWATPHGTWEFARLKTWPEKPQQ